MSLQSVSERFMQLFNRSENAARPTEADLVFMEAALDTVLPASYCAFITSWGEAFTPSLLTLIVNKQLDLFDVQNIPLPREAVEDTKAYWSGGMPTDLIGIASDCMGNMFGFARLAHGSPRPPDAPVLVFDHEANEVFQVAPSFEAFLQAFIAAAGEAA